MLPDRVTNPGSLTYESGALPIALRCPARGIRGMASSMSTTLIMKLRFPKKILFLHSKHNTYHIQNQILTQIKT